MKYQHIQTTFTIIRDGIIGQMELDKDNTSKRRRNSSTSGKEVHFCKKFTEVYPICATVILFHNFKKENSRKKKSCCLQPEHSVSKEATDILTEIVSGPWERCHCTITYY